MRLVEGPFKKFGAHWRFTSLSPDAVKVEFTLEYEFASRLIAALLDPVFSRIADSTVAAFVRRVAERAHG
jgi:ribosome-associated toxin RatA of RatAB toxin-antitoxin module